MQHSKLMSILKKMPSEDWKGLRKAVLSPLFNTSQTVKDLFEKLRKQHPNFDETSKGRRKLFGQLFPKEKFNESKLRRHFTELTKVVEQYLVHQELKREHFQQKQILVKIYGRLDLVELMERENRALLQGLEQQPIKNAEHHWKKLHIHRERYHHVQHNKYSRKDGTLEDLADSLDAYFLLTKMELSIAMKNRMQILKKESTIRYWDILQQPTHFLADNPLLTLFQLSLKLLREATVEDFQQYEKHLFLHLSTMVDDDRILLYFNGLNYAARQLNQGKIVFQKIALKWYKKDWKSGFCFGTIK